jgi:oxaloacetate decarboxylase beta subunit
MSVVQLLLSFFDSTGISALTWLNVLMVGIGGLLIYLGIAREYEPLLLVPIGFGAILVNMPLAGLMEADGLLHYFYFGIKAGIFPPLIFLGVGAMTDFGPLLSKPQTFLLGAAAQFGIFGTLLGARALGFPFNEAASIAIIGGADGPTAIYLTARLADHLLGPIAVAAYSYMALVPIIQPPIIRLLTTKKERVIVMSEIKPVSQRVKILFPILTTIASALLVPASTPLIGMLMLGNLFREAGVVERLSKTAQNELINIVTIFLGVAVGSQMSAEKFLNIKTLMIILLGLAAFSIGTTAGVLLGKMMCILTKGKVNPMIGAAGVSAVPMAARVVQKVGQKENPSNFLLMNAMGPNVAGVIGSAVAAGVLLAMAG